MAAMNSFPSADIAAQVQDALGISLETQVVPELVEVKMPPLPVPNVAEPLLARATAFVPSADSATQFQLFVGRLVFVQFTPALVEI